MPWSLQKMERYFAEAPHDASLELVDRDRLPQHVAVIMDGNGRWATQRGKKRSAGHAAGIEGLRELIKACARLGIPYLTVYAFSTENWARSKEEVDTLMQLFAQTLIKELALLQEESVTLKFLGDMTGLPQKTRETFEHGIRETADNTGLTLMLAVNYGSRAEIVRAARALAQQVSNEALSVDEITEDLFAAELYTAPAPDPDLLIRTSGENRLSNFLLWQLAYAEFVILPVLWPDFTRFDLLRSVIAYQGRSRRFGGSDSHE